MFKLVQLIEDSITLKIELPQGLTQEAINNKAIIELEQIEEKLYGKHILINGRITTGLSMLLGHKLAHICKSVSLFDPKENKYFKIITH